jgi:Mg-chelatase subunit ChlD
MVMKEEIVRAKRTREQRQKGFALVLTTLCMLMMIPTVGLAIDAGFLYAIKAKLQAATDAAALAAARSLSVGIDMAAQENSARARARSFFDANFPNAYLQTSNKQVTVAVWESGERTRSVRVTGSVTAPIFFMRFLGFHSSSVVAEGLASRRDVNLIMVLDKSGSLSSASGSGSCDELIASAKYFASQFANRRDRLGMITFSSGWFKAYPQTQNFKDSPTLESKINSITCVGGTGTAPALWNAYKILHDEIAEPGALNVIVFFSDGRPTALSAYWPVKKQTDTRYRYTNGDEDQTYTDMPPSTCKDVEGDLYDRNAGAGSPNPAYRKDAWNPNWTPPSYPNWINPSYATWNPLPPAGTVPGMIIASGNGIPGTCSACSKSTGVTWGVFVEQATSSSDHNNTFQPMITTSSSGCSFNSNNQYSRRDIAYIPNEDNYGNSTLGQAGDPSPAAYPGTNTWYAGRNRVDRPDAVAIAARNTALDAAGRIRQDALGGDYNVITYAIGLGIPEPPPAGMANIAPADHEFMRRIANDPASPTYNSSEPTGLYVFAPDNTQLNLAFARIASEILRLAQ